MSIPFLVFQERLDGFVQFAGLLVVLALELTDEGVVDALLRLVLEDDARYLVRHSLILDDGTDIFRELVLHLFFIAAGKVRDEGHIEASLLPELAGALEALVLGDDVVVVLRCHGDEVTEVCDELEVEGIRLPRLDFRQVELCFAGVDLPVHAEGQGVRVLTVKQEDDVLLLQVLDALEAREFDVFVVDEISVQNGSSLKVLPAVRDLQERHIAFQCGAEDRSCVMHRAPPFFNVRFQYKSAGDLLQQTSNRKRKKVARNLLQKVAELLYCS